MMLRCKITSYEPRRRSGPRRRAVIHRMRNLLSVTGVYLDEMQCASSQFGGVGGMEAVFLVCFLVGLCMTVISLLFGTAHIGGLHLGHDGEFGHQGPVVHGAQHLDHAG